MKTQLESKWNKFATLNTPSGSELVIMRLCADESALYIVRKLAEADKDMFSDTYVKCIMTNARVSDSGRDECDVNISATYPDLPDKINGDQDLMVFEETDKGMRISY